MSNIWPLLVILSLMASACGSSSSSGDGSAGNDGSPIVVTVNDYSGMRVPNATVVLGDSNGAMKTYGVTDAKGQITFDHAPDDATITAATTCLRSGSTTTNYSIDIRYDANGSAILSLNNCSDSWIVYPAVAAMPLGTLTLEVTNTPSQVIENQITVGRQVFGQIGGVITRQTVGLTQYDLDNDGTFSVMVIGNDVNRNPIAYGILLDQPFTDGMTLDVQMQPMSFVQYQISNLPATAVTLRPSLNIYRMGKQGYWWAYSYSLLSAPSSTTIQAAYIPAFGSGVNYQVAVDLDQNHDGVSDSQQGLSVQSYSTPTSQSFDFNKALPAPNVTVTGADTGTPTLSWSGVDPAAPYIYVYAFMHSAATSLYLNPGDLSRSRTSIRYPELPDSLAAFRPDKVDYFSVSTSAYEGTLYKTSSGTYNAPNP